MSDMVSKITHFLDRWPQGLKQEELIQLTGIKKDKISGILDVLVAQNMIYMRVAGSSKIFYALKHAEDLKKLVGDENGKTKN